MIVAVIVIALIFSLTCYPLGIMIIAQTLSLTWECLSVWSVLIFLADLLLKDDYGLINLKKREVSMNKIYNFNSSGVYMG